MQGTTLLTRHDDMRPYLVRYAKFLGISLLGSIVDNLVLWILSDFAFTKGYWGEYIISPTLSFQAAVLFNYSFSYLYVWKDRVSDSRGPRNFLLLYLAYNVSCSTVFLIRLGVIVLIERFTGWDVILCNILAMCVSGLVNFLLTNNVVFRRR